MNNSEKVDMLFVYWECEKNSRQAARAYVERYPNRQHPSQSYFHKLERNLRSTGSFSNIRVIANQQPRQVNALGEDIELQVLAYVRANPRVSTRHVGFEIGISHKDGAPAHNAIVVKNYLNEYFENRWIGTNGIIKWPPRSPDLTPLDYFLWGYLKTVVYANPPTNLIDLKQKIIAACNQLTEGQISSATNKEFLQRTEACLNYNREQFEQFIR
ncbi:uncharacterized protein LOC112598348 [Melanaphis sacchari]|uniref:uncharacterized protein LOC112598348 n=1 Tax=Melanaphis sacchari TaxID=742174 RepID=UPI000DC15707|nr:uncharacterized protein LOC112598348 [Melanaphis sacchari]